MQINIKKIMEVINDASEILKDRELALKVEEKGDFDYVTEVDLKVQQFIESRLGDLYPEIQFMGEEKSNDDINIDDRFWVLDPIDGTTNLIHDYPHIAISLALVENREVVLGFVYNPYMNEMFFAQKGGGTYLNDKRVHVSDAKDLSESLMLMGTSPYQKELGESNFKDIFNVFEKSQDIRRSGSAALDLAYIACGRVEGFFEKVLQIWDFSAGSLLVQEAGGKVTDYNGKELALIIKSEVAASNGKIHDELIDILKDS